MAHFNTNFLHNKLKNMKDSEVSFPDIHNSVKEEIVSKLIEVSSVESFFGKFSNELDDYFTSFPIANKSREIDIILAELSTSSIANYFLYRKNAALDTDLVWQWLDKLMYCIKMHVKTAGEYHQFIEKLFLCKEGIKSIHLCLKSIHRRLPKISILGINSDLKECLLIMLNIVDMAEDLFKIHMTIIPVHHRVCNTERMNAKLLIDCSISNIDLAENDEVVVIEKNFETNLWTVEKLMLEKEEESVQILKIPSLFLMLESHDQGIIKKCYLLKSQLMGAWKSIISQFESFIVVATNDAIETTELSKNVGISPNICHAVLDSLIKSLDFDGRGSPNIDDIMRLRQRLEDDSAAGDGDGRVQNWNILNETVQLFADTKIYSLHFESLLQAGNHREECYISINNPRYVTMAYISNIPDDIASEMDLKTPIDNTVTTISDDTLNGTDNISESSLTPIPEDKVESGKSSTTSPINSSYRSSFKFYLHESSFTPKIQTVTMIKPNPFIVQPTLNAPLKEVEEVFEFAYRAHELQQNAVFLNDQSDEDPKIQNADKDYSKKDVYTATLQSMDNITWLTPEFSEKKRCARIEELEYLEGLEIVGIVKTDSQEIITFEDAINTKIIDLVNVSLLDIKNNIWIPLKEAIVMGFVLTEPKGSRATTDRVYVDWIRIGRDQRKVMLKEATVTAYVDPLHNVYHILDGDSKITFVDAIMCGIIKIIDPSEQQKIDFENFIVIHRGENDPTIEELCKYEMKKPMNVKMLSKVQESDCWDEFFEVNDKKERFAESIYNDHLDVDPLMCGDRDKGSILVECVKGNIKLDKVVDLLENLQEIFVGEVIGSLDTISSGKDVCSKLDEMKNVDKRDVFVMDCEKMNIMSVDKIDGERNDVLFITRINVELVKSKLKQLIKLEESGVDTSKNVTRRQVGNKCDVFDMTMMEAVMNDVILLDTLEIRDKSEDQICGLEESVKRRLIELETAENLLDYAAMLDFDSLIRAGIFNVETNLFGEEGSLKKAIEEDMVEPMLVYVVNKNEFTTLGKMVEAGILNGETNEVTMENVTMKLSEAIDSECGMLMAKIDHLPMKKRLPKPFKDVREECNLNYTTDKVSFDRSNIDEKTIHDAIELGLLFEDSIVSLQECKDGDVKRVSFRDNLDLAVLVDDANKLMDMFANLEQEYAASLATNCSAERESDADRYEKLEGLLFDVLENENFLEDKIENFIESDRSAKIVANQIQLSFLIAQMENVKNLSSKISHDIQGSSKTNDDGLSSITVVDDEINALRLCLNNIDRELNTVNNPKNSPLSKIISLEDLKERCRGLSLNRDQIALISPKFFDIKVSLNALFDRHRGSQDDSMLKKVSDLERGLLSLKTLRDNVSLKLQSLTPYFEDMLDNYNKLEHSMDTVEQRVHEMEGKLSEEVKCIPLNIQQLDDKFETLCKLKREVSDVQPMLDNVRKYVNGDFKGFKLLVPLEQKLQVDSSALEKLKFNIDIQKKELGQTKNRVNEMKQMSNNLAAELNKVEKSLKEVKAKGKTEEMFQRTVDIRTQFMGTLNQFEQLRNSCESYINNVVYVNKDSLILLRQTVIDNQRDLYIRINDELILQVESQISLLLMDIGKLQMFVLDLPKSWNTNTEDINLKIEEIKDNLSFLKEVEKKLQDINYVLSKDLVEKLDIDYNCLENTITNIQYCEKVRVAACTDLEKILEIVCSSFLPTIVSYENNKRLADSSLSEITKCISTAADEFNTFTNDDTSKFAENFADTVQAKRNDLQRIRDQLLDLESMVDAVESYGFDIIEQLINLSYDYGTGCTLLSDIKNEIQELTQRFKDAKTSISDLDARMGDLILPSLKSVSEQINDVTEGWNLINDMINRLDPVQSRPEKIREQEKEIAIIWDKIKKKESQFNVFKQSINLTITEPSVEDNGNADDTAGNMYAIVEAKTSTFEAQEAFDSLKDVEILIESVSYKVEHRMAIIQNVLGISNNFWPEITSLNQTISEIQKAGNAIAVFPNTLEVISHNIVRQLSDESESPSIVTMSDNRSPAASVDLENEDKLDKEFSDDEQLSTEDSKNEIDSSIVKTVSVCQQNELLKKMDVTVEECVSKLHTELEPTADKIIKEGGQSCAFEVNDYLESVWENVGDVQDILEEKHIELDKGMLLMSHLEDELKKMSEWFPSVENRLHAIKDVSPDQKMIELNINQLKSLDAEVFSRFSNMESISAALKEILNYPFVPNKSRLEDVKNTLDEKYSAVVEAIISKHKELQEKYTEIGEVDFVLEDNIGILQELENQIKYFSRQTSKGDPQFTSSCLRNLKVLSNAFEKQQSTIANLNATISTYHGTDEDVSLKARGTLTIFGKLKEINDLSRNITDLIPEKEKLLEEILRNEKLLSKDIQKFTDYLDSVKVSFKHSPKVGLTQDSVDQFTVSFITCVKELDGKEEAIRNSIEMANTLMSNCPAHRCSTLATAVKTLSHKYKRCKELAAKRKDKLDHYSQIIVDFDRDKSSLFRDVIELENLMLTKAYPSKLTPICAEQVKSVKIQMSKTDKYIDALESLNIRSFEIKCFGNRFENSQLHLEFKDYELKLAKIQRCLRERLRIFVQAYKEDKLFSDSYDSLNTWLDDSFALVNGFKHEPSKVQDHLDKLKHLCQQLSAQYANFHCTIRYGTYLKDRCLETDPEREILFEMLKNLKQKWIKIRNLIIAEKTSINRKLIETGNLFEAIKCFSYWIKDLISKFDTKMKLNGDLDTVEVLVMDCQTSVDEADIHLKDFGTLKQRILKEIKDYEEGDLRTKIADIEGQFVKFLFDLGERKNALKDSLELAQQFNDKLEEVRLWTNKAEKQLKLKSFPKLQNEAELINLIGKHETFLRKLHEMKVVTNDMNGISKTILANCHPLAKNYISRVIFTTNNRYSQICQRAEARSKKLNEALGTLRGSTALIEELIQKVTDSLNKIRNENNSKVPEDIESVNLAGKNHTNFHNDVIEMDSKIKSLIKEFKIRNPNSAHFQKKGLWYRDRADFYNNIWRNSKENINQPSEELTSNSRLNLLNSQFNVLWKLSVERKAALQTKLKNINEEEMMKKFDFNSWREEFMNFVKVKGLRLTDLFRRQAVKTTGYLTEEEFMECIRKSKFPTQISILKEVFRIFDISNDNKISYQEFISAMRPERRSIDSAIKAPNLEDKKAVMKIIHDIIENEVSKCKCRQRFLVKKEGENKYRFGNNNKMYMVRYLNSSVMVRIGGGWQNLTEFLKLHDECRGGRPSLQQNAADLQRTKGFKSLTSSEPKTGTISASYSKSKSAVEDRSAISSSLRKDPLSTSLKSQPSTVTKLPKKK